MQDLLFPMAGREAHCGSCSMPLSFTCPWYLSLCLCSPSSAWRPPCLAWHHAALPQALSLLSMPCTVASSSFGGAFATLPRTPSPTFHSLSQLRPLRASQRLAAPSHAQQALPRLFLPFDCLLVPKLSRKKTHFRTLTAFSYCTRGTAPGNCPARAPLHCPCGPPSPARGRPFPSAAAARTRSQRSATSARTACP